MMLILSMLGLVYKLNLHPTASPFFPFALDICWVTSCYSLGGSLVESLNYINVLVSAEVRAIVCLDIFQSSTHVQFSTCE
jgi:hypothetical protein